MKTTLERQSEEAEKLVRDIRLRDPVTIHGRRKSAHCDPGLRGKDNIAGLCRKEGISQSMEASKKRQLQQVVPTARKVAGRHSLGSDVGALFCNRPSHE